MEKALKSVTSKAKYALIFLLSIIFITLLIINPGTAFAEKPNAPVTITPTYDQIIYTESVTFSWHPVDGATSYLVEYYQVVENQGENFQFLYEGASTTISWPFSLDGSWYTWRVSAYNSNSGEWSDYSTYSTFRCGAPPTSAPIITAPDYEEVISSTDVEFNWSTVTNATAYKLEYKLAADVEYTLLHNGEVNYYVAGSDVFPIDGSWYDWRVSAGNLAGWGPPTDVSTFRRGEPPVQVVLTEPAYGDVVSSNDIFFNWNTVEYADNYKLELKKSSDSEYTEIYYGPDDFYTTNINQQLPIDGTVYDWKVTAINGVGPSESSQIWQFKRGAPPVAPDLWGPDYDAVDDSATVTFEWGPVEYATHYKLEVKKDGEENYTELYYGEGSSYTTDPAELVPIDGSLYLWKVTAENLAGFGDESNTWQFYRGTAPAAPLDPPALINPGNGALITDDTVLLQWSEIVGAERYYLTVLLANGDSIGIDDQIIQDPDENPLTSFELGLEPGKTYHWKVASAFWDDATLADVKSYSDEWTFTRDHPARFYVDPQFGHIQGQDWPPNTTLTININNGSHTSTVQTCEYGGFYTVLESVEINGGESVTISGGGVTESHVVTNLHVTGADVNADTVTGQSNAFANLEIKIDLGSGPEGMEAPSRLVQADENGNWLADFSVEGTVGCEYADAVYNIEPGTEGIAIELDNRNNGTLIKWSVPDPRIMVNPIQNEIRGTGWTDESEITINIDGTEYTTYAEYEDWGGPGSFYFDNDGELSITPGQVVTVSDESSLQKTHTITNLAITEVDLPSDTVSGTATPASKVTVDLFDDEEDDNVISIEVTTDESGRWSADFSEPGDDMIDRYSVGLAYQTDDDGDRTWLMWPNDITCQITVTADPEAGGTVGGSGTYPKGATATVSAFPNAGYRFSHWKENGQSVSTLPEYSFTVAKSRNLTAQFIKTHLVTVQPSVAAGGTVTGGGSYDEGAQATVTATPFAGTVFVNWTENDEPVSTNASYSFPVIADRVILANFKPKTPVVLTPINEAIVTGPAVTLRWGSVPNASHYWLNLYPLGGGSNIYNSVVFGTEFLMDSLPQDGTAYGWKVMAHITDLGWGDECSETTFTSMANLPAAPNLIKPVNNGSGYGPEISFEWFNDERATSYRLEILLGTTIVFAEELQLGEYEELGDTIRYTNVEGLPPFANTGQQYSWRVAGVNLSGTGPWSAVWRFRNGLQAPLLLEPANRGFAHGDTVTFSWEETVGADDYRLEVKQGSKVIYNNLINSDVPQKILNSAELIAPAAFDNSGKEFTWRVAAVSNFDGRQGPWSAAWRFKNGLQAPLLLEPANRGFAPGDTVTFSWEETEGANDYRLEVKQGSKVVYNNLINSDVPQKILNSAELIAPAAFDNSGKEFTWRVAAVNNGTTSPWSAAWRFKNGLQAPLLLEPANRGFAPGDTVTFSWEETVGADDYRLEVKQGSKVVYNNLINSDVPQKILNSAELIAPAAFDNSGKEFTWRVAAVSNFDGRQGPWSAAWRFKNGLQAPLLLEPANRGFAPGNTVTFSWEETVGADDYRLEVKQGSKVIFNALLGSADPHLDLLNAAFDNSGKEFTWRVAAVSNFDGRQGPWSAAWRFKNRPLEPVLISPLNKDIERGKTVSFQWTAVEGADFYRIEIKSGKTILKNQLVYGAPFVTFTNLPADGKTYTWRVASVTKEGYSYWSASRSYVNRP